MNYAPISFKSDYSLLKSLFKVKDIISYAKENGSSYVGILDDNPYGIMDFYDKCSSAGIKGIFGVVFKIGDNRIYLYIKDYIGYQNVIRLNELVSDSKLTINDLYKFNSGLVCVLPYGNYNLYNRLRTAYDVYLGYKNEAELKNASQITKNVLFLNEILCLKKEDEIFLGVLYKIGDDVYERGEHHVLEATEFDKSTVDRFQAMLDLKFEFGKRYIPTFCKSEAESLKLLRTLALKGLDKRMHGKVTSEYMTRLKFELEVIESMGFVDYFLIVYDYVKYAKKSGIMVGPGRGSAAGSLVSYTLGITDIDPIKYDLLFERFLNPERITMPDIDMDFEDERRNEVIDYVKNKYGPRYVSQIVAYGSLKSRQVVRDVGKVLGVGEEVISDLTKLIDSKQSLRENIKNQDLVKFIKEEALEMLYKISLRLEGLKKHTTIHAAGVIISSFPLLELIPTIKSNDGILTGYTMEYLEKLGLLKMDFLAVRNLTNLHRQIQTISKKMPEFDIRKISLSDEKTFKLLSSGKTDGIFQFETQGMKNFLKKLTPRTFDDLIAAVALFRPGPMQNIDEYISRQKGQRKISYLHKDLEPILNYTYGIIVYQEQIMQILSKMGGYSFSEADLIRRAMSKKKKEVMEKESERFVKRTVERGYSEDVASKVYELIVKFADYGFNKAHSVAYALIGYQMAYLKANYTDLVHVDTLNMNIGSSMKTKDIIDEAKKRGMKIQKPSINMSSLEYTIDNKTIVLPLTCIKNISAIQGKTIVENQPYHDFFEFFKKIKDKGINRSAVETLIKAGAMDEFGVSKNTLLKNIDSALTYVELVESLDESLVMKPEIEVDIDPDTEYSELDIFGFYVSGHPASKYREGDTAKLDALDMYMNRITSIAVLVDKIKIINTKKGEKMAFLDISDDTKPGIAVIFPRNYSLIQNVNEGGLYKFKGKVGKRNEDTQFIIEESEKIEFEC